MPDDLLFLSLGSPWPAQSGAGLRTWGLLRQIARRHAVDLVVLARTPLDAEQRAGLSAWVRSTTYVEMRDTGARDRLAVLGRMAGGIPYHPAVIRHSIESHPELRERIRAWPGIVFTNTGHWGTLALESVRPRRWILNQCDADIDFWRAYAEQAGSTLIRGAAQANYRLARRHFPAVYAHVGRIICVCEEDRELTAPFAGATPIKVIANGIELRDYQPRRAAASAREGCHLLFTGTSARRNLTALRDFLENVFPRVRAALPAARLRVAGNFSPEAQADFRGFDAVEFTGRVPEMTPYFDDADIFIAPFRDAHGSKLKVAEAMAMALPIVATRPAVRGFPLVHGESALIAEDDAEFAEQIIRLATRPEARERIGQAARAIAERTLDWEILGRRVEEIIQSVAGEAGLSPQARATAPIQTDPAADRLGPP